MNAVSRQRKAQVLLTMFLSVFLCAVVSHGLSAHAKADLPSAPVLNIADDDQSDWIIRITETEKDGLSHRHVESLGVDWIEYAHSVTDQLQLQNSNLLFQLFAPSKLFLAYRKLLI